MANLGNEYRRLARPGKLQSKVAGVKYNVGLVFHERTGGQMASREASWRRWPCAELQKMGMIEICEMKCGVEQAGERT